MICGQRHAGVGFRSSRPAPRLVRVSSVFCARLIVGTAPRPRRSSGTKCRPSCAAPSRRVAGRCRCRSVPSRPAARRVLADSAAISSCWPLPETPATPTISPARTSRDRLQRSTPNWSCAGSDRSRRRQHHGAGPGLRVPALGGSAPIIRRDRLALLSCVGSTSPGDLAAAQHRAVVAQRADLVELVADVEDAAAADRSWRSVTKSFSTACGVSTDGGLVQDQQLGVSSARTISTAGARRPTANTARAGPRPGRRPADLGGCARSPRASAIVPSRPSQTFSAAVSVSNS